MKNAIIYILNTIGFFILFLLVIFGLYFFLDNYGILFQNKGYNIGEIGDLLSGTIGLIISVFTLVLVYKTFISQSEELKSQRNELIEQRNEYKLTRAYDLFYKELELIEKDFDSFKNNGAFKNFKGLPIDYIFEALIKNMKDYRTRVLKGDIKNIQKTTFNNNFKTALLFLLQDLNKRNDSINVITKGLDRRKFEQILVTKTPNNFSEFLMIFSLLIESKDERIKKELSSGKHDIKFEINEIETFKTLIKRYNENIEILNLFD